MAEVKKARLFLRRGTDTDRKLTTLCEGELGYSTDAFRVVVGDGTTAGGLSLGSTAFVSAGAGALAPNFHTSLTEASAGGLALSGDFAVFSAATYVNGNGDAVDPTTTTGTSATTVMLLTGSDASDGDSWVAVNSGIPWGNIDTPVDAISGDQIHGGDISGDVTFSGQVSTTASTVVSAAGDVHVAKLVGTGIRNVVATATGQLSAVEPDDSTVVVSNATGAPVVMATFGQTGSSGSITPKYNLNVTSVTETTLAAYTSDSGDVQVSSGSSAPAYSEFTSGAIAVDSGTGIYKLVFPTVGAGYADRPVVVIAANYRGRDPEDHKVVDETIPITDYWWKSQTILYVIIGTGRYSNVDSKASGDLGFIYPNSGMTDSRTRFTVQVY